MVEIPATTLEAHYEKSNFFRVVHADGMFGGLSPSGHLHIAFFNQRTPLPKKSSISVATNGVATETVTDTKTGLFREIEVDITMDLNTSLSFHVWLSQNLNLMRKQLGMSDEDWSRHIQSINAAFV
jgi:hypothetical protein